MDDSQRQTPQASLFVLADDDKEAASRIMQFIGAEWYIIPISEPQHVLKYAQQFSPKAIFLAEPLSYPKGGAARLLQKLIDEVGKPVVILTESDNPEDHARWKRMGASDCIPHPTRIGRRLEGMRALVQDFALEAEPGDKALGKRT